MVLAFCFVAAVPSVVVVLILIASVAVAAVWFAVALVLAGLWALIGLGLKRCGRRFGDRP